MAVYGFIGTGNMGGALAQAACQAVDPADVILADHTAAKAEALAARLGCRSGSNEEAAAAADLLFLGVKPHAVAALLDSLAPVLEKRKTPYTLVSMAAGLSVSAVQAMSGGGHPVIRIMPNTPSAIGQGMILYTCAPDVSDEALQSFLTCLSRAGRLLALPEALIDAGSAVSGCGPAYADLFIQSLADGGVACGLPRAAAQELAAQTVLGAAALILETGRHPDELKDAVCSPGGTTIQGVRVLEERAFRGAVMDAVIAAYDKTLELKK